MPNILQELTGQYIPPNVRHSLETRNSFVPKFAEGGNIDLATKWMSVHVEVPVIMTVLYLSTIYFLQRYMADKKPYSLKTPLVLWNFSLALFSLVGTVMILPLHAGAILTRGLSYDLCNYDEEYLTPWTFIFCLSKIPEFLDTFFLVLRKRPVIFLHWYHHVATMWFCWMAVATQLQCGGAFATLNLAVHSIMYTYFGFSSLGVRFPQLIRKGITSLQILQMVVGLEFVIHTLYLCPYRNHNMLRAGLVMYLSYFVLFAELFYNNYVGNGGKQHSEGKQEDGKRTDKMA
eukprot:TRINITY_DN4677_c0_g1_i1.p1 TRINITY_DN4677_c0_g1~~TRINITY_DN4677_c0_g1_i1.p1  ORF type:complete len:289 (-),score=39.26 TRINITY_DN4677_c0_g1_i1:219-1085(-)